MEAGRRRRVRPAPPDVVTADEVLHVNRTHEDKDAGTTEILEDRQDVLATHRFVTEPAHVRVSAGVTRNMGNFEFLRVDISLSVPCYVGEIDEVAPRVADKVAAFLDKEVETYCNGDNDGS